MSDSVGMLIFAVTAIGDGAVLWKWPLSTSSQETTRLLHLTKDRGKNAAIGMTHVLVLALKLSRAATGLGFWYVFSLISTIPET